MSMASTRSRRASSRSAVAAARKENRTPSVRGSRQQGPKVGSPKAGQHPVEGGGAVAEEQARHRPGRRARADGAVRAGAAPGKPGTKSWQPRMATQDGASPLAPSARGRETGSHRSSPPSLEQRASEVGTPWA